MLSATLYSEKPNAVQAGKGCRLQAAVCKLQGAIRNTQKSELHCSQSVSERATVGRCWPLLASLCASVQLKPHNALVLLGDLKILEI